MLEEILPAAAAVAAVREDVLDAPLFPEEEAMVAHAVEKRRLEFTTGRACARAALGQLGVPAQAIPPGPRGAPLWPRGFVGSITHCRGYRAAAVAPAAALASLGVDAEPNEPLPTGVLADIALPGEAESLRRLRRDRPEVRWDRLLFCMKEAVYKAWFPLAERWLGFEDATVAIEPVSGSFAAHLLVAGPRVGGRELRGFSGRWLARDGLLLAAIAHPPPGRTANKR